MADISSVLSERTFTFVVGEQKQEFHIHPSVTRGVSEPLYKLMTNGHMKESVSRTAFLPELEPTVFADFCRYSYHAISGSAPCLASRSELSNSMLPYDGLRYFFCRHCGSGCRSEDINRDFYPFCTGAQKNQNENTSYNSNHCAACGKDNMPGAKYQHGQPRCCDRCTKTQMTETEALHVPMSRILELAKLFSFADMYLVEDLKEATLKKLEHKLGSFPVEGEDVGAVVDLLRYTYEHTKDMEEDGIGALRKLVASYAIEHAKELGQSDEFMKLLSCGGDIVEEIVGPVLRK